MIEADGIHIVTNPRFPQTTQLLLKVKVSTVDLRDVKLSGEEAELTISLIAAWPIEINLDDKGCNATLVVPIKSMTSETSK